MLVNFSLPSHSPLTRTILLALVDTLSQLREPGTG